MGRTMNKFVELPKLCNAAYIITGTFDKESVTKYKYYKSGFKKSDEVVEKSKKEAENVCVPVTSYKFKINEILKSGDGGISISTDDDKPEKDSLIEIMQSSNYSKKLNIKIQYICHRIRKSPIYFNYKGPGGKMDGEVIVFLTKLSKVGKGVYKFYFNDAYENMEKLEKVKEILSNKS